MWGLGFIAMALAAPPSDPVHLPDLERWVGVPLADVQLVGPEGGLPDESLAPLLRATLVDRLELAAVRLDVRTLYQVGAYRAVEAHVEPWFVLDDDGNEVDAAVLTYVVYPAPRIDGIRVSGNRHFSDRHLLDASGLSPGQVFYAEQDGPIIIARVARWLRQRGFTRARVGITLDGDTAELDVDEGEPNLLQSLTFTGAYTDAVSERMLRRWAKQSGVQVQKAFAPEAIGDAKRQILERLGDPRSKVFRRRRGYVAARVTPAVINRPSGASATINIEAGPQLVMDIDGLSSGARRKVSEALDINHRTRLTRGFLDEAPERVAEYLQDRGFYDATANVDLNTSDTKQVLLIEVDRGARYNLKTGRFPSWVGVQFEGNEHLTDAELQAVLDQASPDILRRDVYTERAANEAIEAAEQLYAARGYLSADLSLQENPRIRRRHGLSDLLRWTFGQPARRRIQPTALVTEGPLTILTSLTLSGEAIELPFFDEEAANMEGAAYSAQAIDRLARKVLFAHRDAGWLDADTRIQRSREDRGQKAHIIVESGEQILLRSVVVQGTRRTRPTFVQREIDMTLGEPVTPHDLEATRSGLYDLGIFRNVQAELLGDGSSRDLVVNVDERPRWFFEAGGGLNTDQGIRTFGRATRRNLLGRANRLELIGQIGLDYRSEDLTDWIPDVTDPEWRLAASYTAPHFPARNQDLIFDVVLRERRQELTWQLDRTGGGIALESRVGKLRLRGATRLEARQLREVDTGALLDGEVWADLINLENPVLPSPWRLQEALTVLAVADLRNDPVRPTSGALVSLTGNWAPGIKWSEDVRRTAFVKGEFRAVGWLPLSGLVVKASLESGYAHALNAVPIPLEERYRIGGTGSMRGFRRDSVGPRNIAPDIAVNWPSALDPLVDYGRRNAPDRWVTTGGDAMAVGSLELQMPFPALGLTDWEGYSFALFSDVGQAWLVDTDATTDSDSSDVATLIPDWRYGVGAGIRVATPIGPLQFDVGANPQRIQAKGEQLRLLRDLYEEPTLRAHLTLGATF